MNKFDVIVIGAGTSGMMAAISAAKKGARTLLLEKNKRVGKKMLLTGGARCNVTNNCSVEELIQHIPGNGKFLYSTFAQFNNSDIIQFFTNNGVSLKEEDHGRMFPTTDQSKTIVEALISQLKKENVTLYTNQEVCWIRKKEDRSFIVSTKNEEQFQSPCVILTTGGKTYPQTGSTGQGYKFAKKMGHTITPLYPTESPLISEENFIQDKTLQGLSLRDVQLSVVNEKNKLLVSHQMDMIFTHFGLSGPAALRCSTFVIQQLKKQREVSLYLDAKPNESKQEVLSEMKHLAKEDGKKSCKNILKKLLPERYITFLLEKAGIDSSISLAKIPNEELTILVGLIKAFPIKISATWPIERSFVTGGGISLKEVQPKSLESKLCEGLFFAGELLDINGYTGGYNVTAALCTGYVSGRHAAEIASYTTF